MVLHKGKKAKNLRFLPLKNKKCGCGGRIWTYGLWVMSPTSYQTAPLRDIRFFQVLHYYSTMRQCCQVKKYFCTIQTKIYIHYTNFYRFANDGGLCLSFMPAEKNLFTHWICETQQQNYKNYCIHKWLYTLTWFIIFTKKVQLQMSFKHPQIKKYQLLADEAWLSTGDYKSRNTNEVWFRAWKQNIGFSFRTQRKCQFHGFGIQTMILLIGMNKAGDNNTCVALSWYIICRSRENITFRCKFICFQVQVIINWYQICLT